MKTGAFWASIRKVDRSRYNSPWLAGRNALATALPLAVGIAVGNPLGAVAITVGALNVSYSDGRDPYKQRAQRMLTWSCLGAFAVFTGSATGAITWAAVPVAAVWAFLGGMVLSISTRAGDLGLNTLVALLVFGARGALSPGGALIAALLVLAGGLLQTAFALLAWTIHRYEPEREALARIYGDLARDIDPHAGSAAATPLTAKTSAQIQETISGLGREHSVEGERYRMLYDQSERIRMSVYVLGRLRAELEQADGGSQLVRSADRMLALASEFTANVCARLTSEDASPEPAAELDALLESTHRSNYTTALESETAAAMDALAGQLRAAAALAAHTTPGGLENFAREERKLPWRLQIRSWIGAMRANLFPGSAIFRHALRLAVCVSLADFIARGISWQRSYWIPMTVAIVLKPDFTTTFSRGALRLAGTLAGLALATGLYHLFPESALTQLFLVGVFTFLLRRYGPGNYGVLSVAISGLVVFLLAAAGTSPRETVIARSIDTVTGGVFALIAYALWPTWERKQVSHPIADLMDATRDYFQAVAKSFGPGGGAGPRAVDEKRRAWRLARSNAEASVDRVNAEPGTTPAKADSLVSMLASLSAAAHSVLGMEAGLAQASRETEPKSFEQFANSVEFMLYFLSQALRGSPGATHVLPKLREDYRRMLDARAELGPQSELVLMETDRLTTALNTLREQVMRYLEAPIANP